LPNTAPPNLPFGIGTNAINLCGRMPQLPSARCRGCLPYARPCGFQFTLNQDRGWRCGLLIAMEALKTEPRLDLVQKNPRHRRDGLGPVAEHAPQPLRQ
jgi:hypothetical protein